MNLLEENEANTHTEKNNQLKVEIKNKCTEQYNESMKQSWFFEITNKIDKPLSELIRRYRENI